MNVYKKFLYDYELYCMVFVNFDEVPFFFDPCGDYTYNEKDQKKWRLSLTDGAKLESQ